MIVSPHPSVPDDSLRLAGEALVALVRRVSSGLAWFLSMLGRVVPGLIQVARSAQLDAQSGVLSAEVDLDTLLAQAPADIRDRITLDGDDDSDDVRVHLDPTDGSITVSARCLRLAVVRADEAEVRGLVIEDLAIVVRATGGALTFAQVLLMGQSELPGDLTASVEVGRLVADSVSGAGGRADGLVIEGLGLGATGLAGTLDGSLDPVTDAVLARATVTRFCASHLAGGGASLQDTQIHGVEVGFDHVDADAHVQAAELSAAMISHAVGQAHDVRVTSIELSASGEGSLVPLLVRWPPVGLIFHAACDGVVARDASGLGGSAARLALSGPRVRRQPDGTIFGAARKLKIRDGRYADIAVDAVAGILTVIRPGLEWGVDGLRVWADRAHARAVQGRQDPVHVDGIPDSPPAALLEQAAPAVGDASARVELPLAAGRPIAWVPVRVRPRTMAVTEVSVQAGQVDIEHTDVTLSRPVRLLWMEFRGAYLTEDGRLKADLGGLLDPNLTGRINKQLGRPRREPLPTGMSELAEIADDVLTAEAAQPTSPNTRELADMARARVDAQITLSSAQLQVAGQVVELGDEAGLVHVTGSLGTGLTAAFERLALDRTLLTSGSGRVRSGRTLLRDGEVHATDPSSGITLRLKSVTSVRVEATLPGMPAPLS